MAGLGRHAGARAVRPGLGPLRRLSGPPRVRDPVGSDARHTHGLTASRDVRNLIVHAGRVKGGRRQQMPVRRRDILKMGLAAAPSLALTRLAEAQIGDPGSPTVFPFRRPLVIPPEITAGGSTINI